MQIRSDLQIRLDNFEASYLDIFTDLGNKRLAGFLDGLAAIDIKRGELFDRARLVRGDGREHRISEGLKVIVLGDEIGLGVDFEYRRGLAVVADADLDRAVGGDAAGLLVGLGGAGFAHQFGGGLDIAIGFDQRFFAFHHARTGTLAQFFH